MDYLKILSVFFIIFITVVVMVGFPFAIIWSLNTLFALGIAYNFWTWLAALILGSLFGDWIDLSRDK